MLQEEVDSLIKYTVELRNYAPDSVMIFSERIIQSSREINYPQGEIKGYFNKAVGFYLLSEDGEAEVTCQVILEKLEAISSIDSFFYHQLTGSTYVLQSILERRLGKYENAVTLELKALNHFEKINDSANIGVTYANISESFRFIKDFDKAAFYNEQAEELAVLEKAVEQIPGILLNRGNILFDQEKYKDALALFEIALEKAEAVGDSRTIINAINNIGASHERMGNFEIGLGYYRTALEKRQEEKDYLGEANTIGNIGMVYLTMKDFNKAEYFLNRSLAISKKYAFLELERSNTAYLAEILEQKGEYSRSLALWKQAQVLQDSLYNQQKFETVHRLEKQFNEERSKRIIAQKDRDLIETELHSIRLRNVAIALGVFFLIVLLSAWLFYRQSRFRKEKNQELLLKNTIIQNQNEDLESLVNAYESQREKFIKIGNHEIQLDQIVYIRYQDRVSSIFLKDQSVVEQRIQLSQLLAELNYKSHFLFSQINQNYIIHFKHVTIEFHDDGEDKYYFTTYLPNDQDDYRNEEVIKTRKRSGLTKNFDREFQRYMRLNKILSK